MLTPVLIHIPHASVRIPEEYRADYVTDDLDGELLRMTDLYCDEIFHGPHEIVALPVSRLLCDVERFRDDTDELMSRIGMGAVYTKCSDLSELRNVTPARREEILQRFYDTHHDRLTLAVQRRLDAYGHCLIIDGHSFPDKPLPYEFDKSPDRPDICIGTDEYHTPEKLVVFLSAFFADMGFTIKINSPFAGSLVPMAFCGREKKVYSVMIEINRRLYMDENGIKIENYTRVCNVIEQMLHNFQNLSFIFSILN